MSPHSTREQIVHDCAAWMRGKPNDEAKKLWQGLAVHKRVWFSGYADFYDCVIERVGIQEAE